MSNMSVYQKMVSKDEVDLFGITYSGYRLGDWHNLPVKVVYDPATPEKVQVYSLGERFICDATEVKKDQKKPLEQRKVRRDEIMVASHVYAHQSLSGYEYVQVDYNLAQPEKVRVYDLAGAFICEAEQQNLVWKGMKNA